MSDQPKSATGEWTTQMVADIVEARKDVSVCVSVSDAHNAALDAAIAAAQKPLVDALWRIASGTKDYTTSEIAECALAKVKEGK